MVLYVHVRICVTVSTIEEILLMNKIQAVVMGQLQKHSRLCAHSLRERERERARLLLSMQFYESGSTSINILDISLISVIILQASYLCEELTNVTFTLAGTKISDRSQEYSVDSLVKPPIF